MKWLLPFIGGRITRIAGAGILIGVFMLAFGVTPSQAVADWVVNHLILFLDPWFKLGSKNKI